MNKVPREAVSVIVPTLNEAKNVEQLVIRIDRTLATRQIPYEIIFIDDHSTDKTLEVAESLRARFPGVRYQLKQGKQGKAYSLLEGFAAAKYPLVCMIDADLQYPPEEIAPMHQLLQKTGADIVVTAREKQKTNVLRRLQTVIFSLVFTHLMFGINYDSQSGLKLFRKQILETVSLSPTPWGFDLEFIVRSLEKQYTIVNHQIAFDERTAGESKVHSISTAVELAMASIRLRRNSSIRKVRRGYKASSVLTGNDTQHSPILTAEPVRHGGDA